MLDDAAGDPRSLGCSCGRGPGVFGGRAAPLSESLHPAVTSRVKRGVDVLAGATMLGAAAPVLAIAAGLVRATSPGPVLFEQERSGLHGRAFKVLKLRTMTHRPGRVTRGELSLADPEVTAVGRWLRRFKLDELPQLWNVVRGDMSLVGPRPTLPEQVVEYDETQRRRLDVRPGLTGLAQVNGNTAISWDERIAHDVRYVDGWSLTLDLRIALMTISVVLLGEERAARRSAAD